MTDQRPVYTAHDIPDLLNALPTFFGFRPEESLVAVATHGPRRRFGFRMRTDVPAARHVAAVADMVVGHLRNNGAEGAVLLAVTRHQQVARDLLVAIEQRLGEIECVVSARADGARYWSDEPGFPAEGVAYETSDHHEAIVHAVAAGQEILPDRQAVVDRFRAVGGERRRWLLHAMSALSERLAADVLDSDDPVALGTATAHAVLDRAITGERLTDDDVLRLAWWLDALPVRDAVWARIDRDTAADHLRVLVHVARHVVPPLEPAVLSLAAFAAWLTGDGAQAHVALDRALEADPDYSMALLMRDLLIAGVPPSAWEGLDVAAA